MRQKLQIACGAIVVSSEIPTNTKSEIIEFIDQATEHQLIALLLDGQIMSVTDDNYKTTLENRFYNSTIYSFLKEDIEKNVAYNIWYILKKAKPLWYSWKGVKSNAHKEKKKCKGNSSCISKVKSNMYKKKLALLKRINCATEQDMVRCERMKKQAMQKIIKKIQKLS